MVRALVVGSAVLDFVYQMDRLPQKAEKYRADGMDVIGGGCAANASVAICRLDGQATLLARLGRDEIADLITADLAREGVNLSILETTEDSRSAVSSIYIDAAGERQIMSYRGSGLARVPRVEVLDSVDADVVLADTRWPEATLLAFALARRLGVPAVLDGEAPVQQDLAKAASHLVFSEQGLMDLAGGKDLPTALKQAARQFPGWVGVTLGAEGVAWVEGGELRHLPGHDVPVRDTLGAGDVWHGAFALSLGEGANESSAARFANAAAALKCTEHGGRKATPNRATVEEFMKQQPLKDSTWLN
ncbi:MAG: sugar kinase [Litoreibacter sp.]|nr:sugar kinase [Litoreibacter sp.]